MRRLLVALALVVAVWAVTPADANQLAGQPHSDVFSCGVPNCQDFNPLSVAIRNGARSLSYRLLTMPGCTSGSIPTDLLLMADDLRTKRGFDLQRNDTVYDYTIRINCGSEQIRICGGVNIFCLGRGFPQNPDVEISDILSTYQPVTRVSILHHESTGHALLTWNEQYCLGTETSGICQGIPRFGPAPGWVDVMNTGPNSRHYLGTIELDRMDRTGLPAAQVPPPCVPTDTSPCWLEGPDGFRWQFPDGGSLDLDFGNCGGFYNAAGQLTWGACDTWGGGARWNDLVKLWLARDGGVFNPAANAYINLGVAIPLP